MKEYTVDIAGVEHTLQLNDEDAKRYPGAKAAGGKSESKVVKKAEDK